MRRRRRRRRLCRAVRGVALLNSPFPKRHLAIRPITDEAPSDLLNLKERAAERRTTEYTAKRKEGGGGDTGDGGGYFAVYVCQSDYVKSR